MKPQNQPPAPNQATPRETQETPVVPPVIQPDPAEEWKQKYVRALADYQNLEKRAAAREEDVRKFAAEITLRKILPSVDSLTAATKHNKDEGLHLAVKGLIAALESCGVTQMKVVGKLFDPFTMECIDVVDGDPEKVVEELAPGYMYFDKVLRVAQVKVGKKK